MMNNRFKAVFDRKVKDLPKQQSEEITSDMLHNKNCYDYLIQLYKTWADLDLSKLTTRLDGSQKFLNYLRSFFKNFKTKLVYDKRFPYGDLYNAFLLDIEELSLKVFTERKTLLDLALDHRMDDSIKQHVTKALRDIHLLDPLIHLIYANENQSLERAGTVLTGMIESIEANDQKATHKQLQESIKKQLSNFSHPLNTWTPTLVDKGYKRFWTHVGSEVKLQTTTSIPSVNSYAYKATRAGSITEYRFGTQVQIHNNAIRIYPTFELWLQSLRITAMLEGNSDSIRIDHIYFNSLHSGTSFNPINRETDWSNALHELEWSHPNILVITMPSNNSLFRSNLIDSNKKIIALDEAKDLFLCLLTKSNLDIIRKKFPHIPGLNDDVNFIMSKKAKYLLYSSAAGESLKEKEENVLSILIDKSCRRMGFSSRKELSAAELQAIYFHLVKFELPNFILETLNPKSFNISCRDAIDRAAISSAYYNLVSSLLSETPLSEAEFNRAIHAAAMIVKGRAINHHFKLFWSAVSHYIYANPAVPKWLLKWRDCNIQPNTFFDALLLCEKLQDELLLKNDNSCFSDIKTIQKLYFIMKELHDDNDLEFVQFTTDEIGALNNPKVAPLYAQLQKIEGILPPIKEFEPLQETFRPVF